MESLHALMKKKPNERARRKALKRILLIDKEPNSPLATTLEREGYHVVHCDCVQKAWGFVYPHRPHLIIFSLHKSDAAALSDLHECRALAGNVPIVLAASAQLSQALVKALPHGTATIAADSSTAGIVTATLHNRQPSTTNN